MTTSTEAKPQKKKGPIRTEAVVPIAIVLLIAFLYFHFLFDVQMRRLIEWTGTYVHGAEVNLGQFKTSFLGGSLDMRDLQVTDKEDPARNLVQIGQIRFVFLWDALLRAKFVVSDAGIDKIQLYSPRIRPGYVKPPEPPSGQPSALTELKNSTLSQVKKGYSDNILGNIASLLEGVDEKEVLNNIKSELKAEATIKALQTELKEKEKSWKNRIENFPRKEEFDALLKRAKTLKFDLKDPKQFAADVKEADRIKKEADKKFDEIQNTSRDLKTDVDKFNSEFRQIDDLIKQDIKDIESRLKIPNLDLQDFSKSLFGDIFAQKLVSVQKYMEVGRKYMPPPKDPNAKKESELIPPARGAGKTFTFPITTSYPLFWLKKASISSEVTPDGFSGKVRGELTNVTTSPTTVGLPAILDVAGDFPKSDIFGTRLKVTIDHVREPKESLEIDVGQYGLSKLQLAADSSLSLAITKAAGSARFSADLHEQNLKIALQNELKSVQYDISAKSKTAKEAVTTILEGIPTIKLNAGASGTWSNFETYLNSNLGRELSAGLKRYVQAKVDQLRARIRQEIDSRIQGEKDKLQAEYAKLKSQIDSVVQSKKAELEKSKDELKAQASKKGESKTRDLKEEGKKLLKKFKF